jgi:hypothetical protein
LHLPSIDRLEFASRARELRLAFRAEPVRLCNVDARELIEALFREKSSLERGEHPVLDFLPLDDAIVRADEGTSSVIVIAPQFVSRLRRKSAATDLDALNKGTQARIVIADLLSDAGLHEYFKEPLVPCLLTMHEPRCCSGTHSLCTCERPGFIVRL